MSIIPACAAIVLAGGESRRMGQDKARVRLGELSLLQQVLLTIQPLFHEQVLSVQQPRPEIDLPQICDEFTQAGPLSGLVSCLPKVSAPWVLLLGCDMPFIRAELLIYLASLRGSQQVIVPVVQGFPQPLLAFYHHSALPVLQQQLAQGQLSLRKALAQLQVLYVDEAQLALYDAELLSFFDLDTPEALQQAQRMLPAGHSAK